VASLELPSSVSRSFSASAPSCSPESSWALLLPDLDSVFSDFEFPCTPVSSCVSGSPRTLPLSDLGSSSSVVDTLDLFLLDPESSPVVNLLSNSEATIPNNNAAISIKIRQALPNPFSCLRDIDILSSRRLL